MFSCQMQLCTSACQHLGEDKLYGHVTDSSLVTKMFGAIYNATQQQSKIESAQYPSGTENSPPPVHLLKNCLSYRLLPSAIAS